MTRKRAKTLWTILIAGTIAVLLPITLVHILRSTMGRMITNDNANIVFQEFQLAIDHGSEIHDPRSAAAIAQQAYVEKTKLVLLDGWGNPMHIYAVLQGNSCELNIQSAGPDGKYGTSDDVSIERTFELPAWHGVPPIH